jgi:hypothetical protein
MLMIRGPRHTGFCDRISRRSFLAAGGLAMGGLSLPQLLRAEDLSSRHSSHKSVIMIFLSGGPPHQDMVDLKPHAPSEIRGEFSPIPTSVPGVQVCELLPRLAKSLDKWAIIRSIVGSDGRHASFMCHTGRPFANQPLGGWPSFGSAISYLQGSSSESVPSFISLSPPMKTSTWADPGQPGFLGLAHAPFQPMADGKADMVLNGITPSRLRDRRSLLARFDHYRRALDVSGSMDGMDQYTEQAYGILTSSKLAEALDLDREDVRLRDRYGRGSPEPAGYGDAGPLLNDYFLMARRLVEAGVLVVSLAYGRWDWHGTPHGTTFENSRDHMPMLDIGLSALVDDLYSRGLDKDVSVVVWGEFGRTPKINANAGRDHWPEVSCALLAGGGMRTGHVIGSTDRDAARPKDRPVHFQEVLATLYHNLGLDVNSVVVPDLQGRPQYLVDHKQPIPELI